MQRILLDTNIYEFLAIQDFLLTKILESKNIKLYGCRIIRDELREIPTHKKIKNKKTRILLLNIYDLLVRKHQLPVTDLARYLALDYAKEYSGNVSKEKIYKDFVLIALASLKDFDAVCTEDFKTMASSHALKAYEKVNQKNRLKTPKFIDFEEFKKIV